MEGRGDRGGLIAPIDCASCLPKMIPDVMVVQPAIASSIGRFLEYSHFRAIELAFNSWCDPK
jgi:hypothetical protein